MNLNSTQSKKLYIVPGVLVGLILAVAVTSMAEEDELDSDPRVVPYNGVLEFNGQALTGNADLQFTIADDLDAEDPDKCSFTELHDNVSVYAGRFVANIGSVNPAGVDDCVFDANSVYISIEVREADSDEPEGFVALSGRQRIRPVPFSYWSAEGSNFKIDGALMIAGDLSNSNGDVVIQDSVDINGELDIAGGLDLTGNIQDTNSDVIINDGLQVTGDAEFGGDVTIGTAVGTGVLNVQGASATSGLDRPHFTAGQFTVDSEDGSGLVNLIAGAYSTTSSGHLYNDDRGASRIRMGDGDMRFYVGEEEGTAGSDVSWTEALRFDATSLTIFGEISDSNSDVIIDDGVDITGNLDVDGSLTVDGAVTLGTTSLDDYIDSRIRSWVRGHCRVGFGWQGNGDGNPTSDPTNSITIYPDGNTCNNTNGSTNGNGNEQCINVNTDWSAIDPGGNNIDGDYFYLRFECD